MSDTERLRQMYGREIARRETQRLDAAFDRVGRLSPCLYAEVVARLRAEGWTSEQIQREVRNTFRRGKT